MPDPAPSAPAAPPVELRGLIPQQRAAECEARVVDLTAPESAGPASVAPAPERLAFVWTMVGALVGSAVVAGLLLVLMAMLP